jgi:peptide/nickel transport system substrate-binding protein
MSRSVRHPIATPFVLFLVFFVAGIVGCGAREEGAPGSAATQGDVASPEEGGRLVLRLGGGLNTLNPVLRTTAYELTVLGFLFDGLVELDRDLNPAAGLAKSWTVSDDGLSYRFLLDPLATWSDGVPVTARDVVFSLEQYKSYSPLISGYLEDLNLEKTRVVDDHTVDVVFDAYHAGQLYTLSIAIVPEHVYSEGDFRTDFNDTVVGNGPFRLARREAGSEILLERRDDYVGARPHVRQILCRVIPNGSVAWSALTRGEIDEMRLTTSQWQLHADDPEAREIVTFHQFYELSYNFVAWNNSKPQLSDANVRRALTMGIDRGALVEHVYKGGARIMSGPYTTEQWSFNPSVSPIPYDPEGAARLLDAAGWRDEDGTGVRSSNGKPLRIEMLVTADDRTSVEQGQIYQDALKKIGVAIDLRSLELTSLIERVLSGRYDGAFLGTTMDLDPDLFANFHSSQFPPTGSNWVRYSNPEIDELLVAGQEERSFEERRRIYQQIHEILGRDQPMTWLVQPSARWAVHNRVKNVRIAPGLGVFGWVPGPREWWIPQAAQRLAAAGK